MRDLRAPMNHLVLERLDLLEAELAALDPTREFALAEQVAAMARALRDASAVENRRHPGARRRVARAAA